ncbi:MAG TPA: type IV pili methyl-accepting chemotaxis transducer N-terminal domain-containing protein [Rhodocyclaceae bacterium]|nr:type IV pili methyl-accepting chemotaxis transducer N-terminal domain-containing protein [Rhodocyclaceae bacterium]
MKRFQHKLSNKIVGILVLYFFVALAAIGMTLAVSRQLEGGAAAINDAGSERMRMYRLAYLASQNGRTAEERAQLKHDVHIELEHFERVLAELDKGNPARPLFLPQDSNAHALVAQLKQRWIEHIRPLILDTIATEEHSAQEDRMRNHRADIEAFVGDIHRLVATIETSNSRNTVRLLTYQLELLALALVGTSVLVFWFHFNVIRPVMRLREGIRRIADADFSMRLDIETQDEFGDLASGFNRMTEQLENMYATMEQRVEAKTRSLAEKNQELALLYEIAAFLSESASEDELCRGFMQRVIAMSGADGAAIRLVDAETGKLQLVAHEAMSESFLQAEATLCMGECLCGVAARDSTPIWRTIRLESSSTPLQRTDCALEGYACVSAFTIRHHKQLIGIFNLYYRTDYAFPEREQRLMETLGRHLGVAIANQRLASHEKETAISDERNQLAQELHDSIAQSLAFLNIQTQMLSGSLARGNVEQARSVLTPIREGIQESYDHVRELLVHFRTRMRQADLAEAIRVSLQKFEGQTGIATHFERHASQSRKIGADNELQILHIVQEALSNTRKHAQAQRVNVVLTQNEHLCQVAVGDDGVGFDPLHDDPTDTHVGLKIMRERAHRIGAALNIRSQPGKGSEIQLTLPLHSQRTETT